MSPLTPARSTREMRNAAVARVQREAQATLDHFIVDLYARNHADMQRFSASCTAREPVTP